jgi:glycosyltransferase involved in cell wall biosynthesis
MNIMVFAPSFPPVQCGVGDYAHRVSEALADRGDRVTVVTSRIEGIERPTLARVLPLIRHWNISGFLRHAARLREERVDLVIGLYPAVLPSRFARLVYLTPALSKILLRRPRVLYVVHEFTRTHQAAQRDLGLAFRFADEVIAVTSADAEAIAARHPLSAGKVRTVPIGSAIPVLDVDHEDLSKLRGTLPGRPRRVLFYFGLLNADKGFGDLLQALRTLPKDVALAASGSLVRSNGYHREVALAIDAAGVGDRVHWLGYLSPADASLWLQAADVVTLPFASGAAENNGSLMAALLNGSAVVTTAGLNMPAWLRDGQNARLVAPGAPNLLSTKIAELLASPELRARLGEAARAQGAQFDYTVVAEHLTA